MFVGIIFIILAIVFIVFACVQSEDAWPMVVVGILSGLLAMLGVIVFLTDNIPEKTEFKYPVNEYKLEYEVLTKGEQVDSTYVLTKIK